MTEMEFKELQLHTLRADILYCGMDGMTKLGIRRLLKPRYVNQDTDITIDEFNRILDEQYQKVEIWLAKQAGKGISTDKGKR